jgi:hypothetical protein
MVARLVPWLLPAATFSRKSHSNLVHNLYRYRNQTDCVLKLLIDTDIFDYLTDEPEQSGYSFWTRHGFLGASWFLNCTTETSSDVRPGLTLQSIARTSAFVQSSHDRKGIEYLPASSGVCARWRSQVLPSRWRSTFSRAEMASASPPYEINMLSQNPDCRSRARLGFRSHSIFTLPLNKYRGHAASSGVTKGRSV